MAGLAAVAGVGFTVSLFITGLVFDGAAELADDARVGVLLGSLIAAGVATTILLWDSHRRREPDTA